MPQRITTSKGGICQSSISLTCACARIGNAWYVRASTSLTQGSNPAVSSNAPSRTAINSILVRGSACNLVEVCSHTQRARSISAGSPIRLALVTASAFLRIDDCQYFERIGPARPTPAAEFDWVNPPISRLAAVDDGLVLAKFGRKIALRQPSCIPHGTQFLCETDVGRIVLSPRAACCHTGSTL